MTKNDIRRMSVQVNERSEKVNQAYETESDSEDQAQEEDHSNQQMSKEPVY